MLFRDAQPNRNYLIFSDVHLGADLVQHTRPWTFARLKRAAKIDRDLATMLDFYQEHHDPERPWVLVIAGDLVDFIGMSIAPLPEDRLETDMTAEEHKHGLGSAYDHSAYKMRAVARRHNLVFEKLSSFVAAGHMLVLVRGNHDVDFHWEQARRAFVEALVERVPGLGADAEGRARFEARIEFSPWFYYVEGLLYVEHGHQYDSTCSYENQLAPISPADPRRISWSFSDVLLRCIVRPTPGVGQEGHESRTLLDYLRLGVSMGFGGGFKLFSRYVWAIAHLLKSWRGRMGERAASIRAEHDRRIQDLAERGRIGVEKLRAISKLASPPITRGAMPILRSLMVDRVALALITTLLIGLLPLLGLGAEWWVPIAAAVVGCAVGLFIWSKRARVIDCTHMLRRGAEHIAALLPTRFVVMGHTHEVVVARVGSNAHYVNVGAWSIDDFGLDGPEREAPRTHLVIRHVDGEPRAELRAWHPDRGMEAKHVLPSDPDNETS